MDINSNEPQARNSEIDSLEITSTDEICTGAASASSTSHASHRMGARTPEITVEADDDLPADASTWWESDPSSVDGLLKSNTEADRMCPKRLESSELRKTPAAAAPRRRSNVEEPYVFSLAQVSLGCARVDLRRLSDPGNRRKRSEDLDRWEAPASEVCSVGGTLPTQPPGAENQATSDACYPASLAGEDEFGCIGGALPWTGPSIRALDASGEDTNASAAMSLSTRVKGFFLCLPEIPLRRRSLSLECTRLEAIAEENAAATAASKASRRYSSPATTKSEV